MLKNRHFEATIFRIWDAIRTGVSDTLLKNKKWFNITATSKYFEILKKSLHTRTI